MKMETNDGVVPDMQHTDSMVDSAHAYQEFVNIPMTKTPWFLNTPIFQATFDFLSSPTDTKALESSTAENPTEQKPSNPTIDSTSKVENDSMLVPTTSEDDLEKGAVESTLYDSESEASYRLGALEGLEGYNTDESSNSKPERTNGKTTTKKRSYAPKRADSGNGCGKKKPVQPLPLPEDGVLPQDHMPARGRRRKIQLQSMTPEQIKAEAAARMEKNRQSARECRRRKKNYIQQLDGQLKTLQAKDRKQMKTIATLQSQLEEMQKQLERLQQQQQHQ